MSCEELVRRDNLKHSFNSFVIHGKPPCIMYMLRNIPRPIASNVQLLPSETRIIVFDVARLIQNKQGSDVCSRLRNHFNENTMTCEEITAYIKSVDSTACGIYLDGDVVIVGINDSIFNLVKLK
jgi:hypothetical protein